MSASEDKSAEPIKIKKYANRRLYNTATSAYVTLDDLAEMLKDGSDFVVNDAKTGEDITHQVLTQIIFEQENKGENLLPIPFLRQLIRFYGDSMQGLVPSFLEISLDQLAQDQSQLRKKMAEPFGANPMELMQDQVRQNMAVFNDAMKMFTPFTPDQGTATNEEPPQGASEAAPQSPSEKTTEPKGSTGKSDELSVLKEQLKAMQAQLDTLSDGQSDRKD